MSDRKLLMVFLFITLILLLRDAPYLNVLIIDKLWIVYILLISLIIFFFIPRKQTYLTVALFLLPFIALIFSLLKVSIGSEVVGVIFYFFLWLVVLGKILAFMREKNSEH